MSNIVVEFDANYKPMLDKSEEARKLLEKAGYAWLEKTIKNFDRLGASVRKYLEASNRPLDKIFSRLGDI